MNKEHLHELIRRYENNIDLLYNEEHDELFKWRAMKVWREEWLKPDSAFVSFGDRYIAAKKEFSLFMDNSRMHPSSGVLKLWELEPTAVESLFRDVLFSDARGDVSIVHNNMDRFIQEYECLRCKHFPRNWSYKQDRHSASVFLAMNNPEFNYVFKASEAQTMAKCIDFGFSIGAGESFSLPNYYLLCNEIVSAIKEHNTLLDKHFSRLTSDCYKDQSLHLLAFDLMYCARAYDFYRGLTPPPSKKASEKRQGASSLSEEQKKQMEADRLAKIDSLEEQIYDLQRKCDEYSDISLVDVQVTATGYGVGTVIDQEINKIRVRFATVEKSFILDRKYVARPRFEDDEEIITAFTEYGSLQEKLKALQRELLRLK